MPPLPSSTPHRHLTHHSWRQDAAGMIEELFPVTAAQHWNLLLDLRAAFLHPHSEDVARMLDLFLKARRSLEMEHYLPFYRLRRLLASSLRLEVILCGAEALQNADPATQSVKTPQEAEVAEKFEASDVLKPSACSEFLHDRVADLQEGAHPVLPENLQCPELQLFRNSLGAPSSIQTGAIQGSVPESSSLWSSTKQADESVPTPLKLSVLLRGPYASLWELYRHIQRECFEYATDVRAFEDVRIVFVDA